MSLDRPGVLVEVQWVDSTGHDGWHEPDQSSELLGKMDCLAAGYLIEDKPEGIVVALGAGGLGQLLDSMAIPRAAIVSVVRLIPNVERSAGAAPSPSAPTNPDELDDFAGWDRATP